MKKSCIKQLQNFFAINPIDARPSGQSIRWLEEPVMKVYVRKACHILQLNDRRALTTLDIANIEVIESERCKGHGFNFINTAHALNPYQATYIETVSSQRFADRLLKDGWLPAYSEACYFKLKI